MNQRMTHPREFTSAAEMMSFYRELRARMKALSPPPVPVVPEPEPEQQPEPEPPPPPPPWQSVRRTLIQRIIVAVAQEFNILPHIIRSRSNVKDIVASRQVVALLAKELTGMSNNAIGAVLGNRDHTTIMHSLTAIAGKMAENPLLALKVERLRHTLLEKNHEHRREQDSERARDCGQGGSDACAPGAVIGCQGNGSGIV